MTNPLNSAPIKGTFNRKRPKTPLPRTWFLSRGYTKADPRYTNGCAIWLHPKTNNVLNQYGNKIKLRVLPRERHMKNAVRYLAFSRGHGSMLLARLKYLTFIGPIPDGYTIDHIDGNTLNNDIRNLRAVPPSINCRDAGFMRKLRNNGFIVAMFPGIILDGYERMAEWKDEHTYWQYRCLKGKELLQVFVGPNFRIEDIDTIMSREMNQHCEI